MSRRASFSLSQIFWCGSSAILILLFTACAKKAEVEDDGSFVFQIEGDWRMDVKGQKERLQQGGTVLVGHKIARASPDGRILILRPNGKVECFPEMANFKESLELGPVNQEPGFYYRVATELVAVGTRLFAFDRLAPNITRGELGFLQEGVVRLEGGQLDLAPAFPDYAKKGKYLLRIRSVRHETEPISGSAFEQLPFEWNGQGPAPVMVGKLPPGIYVLSRLRISSEEHEPTGDQSWIFATEPADFEEASATFQHAKEISDKGGECFKGPTVRAFLRACLGGLASGKAKSIDTP